MLCYLCIYLLLRFKLYWWVSHDEYNMFLYVTFTVKVPFSFYFILLIIFMLLNWIIPDYLSSSVRPTTQMSLSTPTLVARSANLKTPVATCISANGKPPGSIRYVPFFPCLLLAASQPTLTCCWLEQVGDERARRSEHPRVQKLWWDIHRSEWLHSSAQQRDTQGDAHLCYHLQRGGFHRQRYPWYSV